MLREYGCRVLIIKQTVYDDEHLLFEHSNGSARKVSAEELETMLKPQETKLNIDVVFVNIQNGTKIA